MQRITFLNASNFSVVGNKTKNLMINLPGNVLVLYKQNDELSLQFDPVFVKLTTVENRVNFAILDVSIPANRDVIGKSRYTTTPIQGTPTLILYISGKPHTRFNGSRTIETIRNFITQSFQQAPPVVREQTQQSFVTPPPQNMYGGGATPQTVHSPVIEQPNLRGKIKNGFLPQVDTEEEPKLEIPGDVVPYNMPWEVEQV